MSNGPMASLSILEKFPTTVSFDQGIGFSATAVRNNIFLGWEATLVNMGLVAKATQNWHFGANYQLSRHGSVGNVDATSSSLSGWRSNWLALAQYAPEAAAGHFSIGPSLGVHHLKVDKEIKPGKTLAENFREVSGGVELRIGLKLDWLPRSFKNFSQPLSYDALGLRLAVEGNKSFFHMNISFYLNVASILSGHFNPLGLLQTS